ncbi:bi-domain-containing oxidoreductase [Kiritimatiellaeota bacterium B1221]|nr:bi-domain-containing oxidoreductase [Kiritimatiellaeota bacterium B1221]
MKQILQHLGNGETLLAEVPSPGVRSGHLLIRTRKTLISLGTEKMLLDFGKGSMLDKARQQPDKVKQVLQKVKTDGLQTTVQAVRSKLDQPIPLGYSNVGVVMEVGQGVSGFKVGDRVLSNGPHAEIICVPQNLCAKIPDGVSDEDAVFTVVSAIGLQGIRLAQPSLGEKFVVTGLGLIGLLTVQLLRAQGCQVLGLDFDTEKCELARSLGATAVDLSTGADPLAAAEVFAQGQGVDGVLITASTKSNDPVHQAAEMCRKRGRIILVGVVGLELQRADFYEKELSFQVSCSYGPGRYDDAYEQQGQDYPLGFVRWTENRNFQAVLNLMADGKLQCAALQSHQYKLDQALEAYSTVGSGRALGILLDFESAEQEATLSERVVNLGEASGEGAAVSVAMLGAGNFVGQVLLPALAQQSGVRMRTLVSGAGVTSTHHGKKHGFEQSATDTDAVYSDEQVNTLMVCTRHNAHAHQVLRGLKAGKNVFVEKPLCMSLAELDEIETVVAQTKSSFLMVGFNRRFSPLAVKMKSLLSRESAPISVVYTVNAGAIPGDHWTQDPETGGGRLIGEACHFIDFCRYLTGSEITASEISALTPTPGQPKDTFSITLGFANGSIATVHYFANGNKGYAKEGVTAFVGGKILELENYRSLKGWGWKGFSKMKVRGQQKGHLEEMAALVDAVKEGKSSPVPVKEAFEVMRHTLQLSLELDGMC